LRRSPRAVEIAPDAGGQAFCARTGARLMWPALGCGRGGDRLVWHVEYTTATTFPLEPWNRPPEQRLTVRIDASGAGTPEVEETAEP
jgi:hypothetical protein